MGGRCETTARAEGGCQFRSRIGEDSLFNARSHGQIGCTALREAPSVHPDSRAPRKSWRPRKHPSTLLRHVRI